MEFTVLGPEASKIFVRRNQNSLVSVTQEVNTADHVVYLGLNELRKHRVIERISGKSGMRSLHFQRHGSPDLSLNYEAKVMTIAFHKRKDKSDQVKALFVDTGCKDFHLQNLSSCTSGSTPTWVKLNFGDGDDSTSISGNLREKKQGRGNYIGLNVLRDNEAIIDYSALDMYLNPNGTSYRITLKLTDILEI